MGTRGSFPGVKRPGRESDYSPQSSAAKKARSYTSTPQCGAQLKKRRENLTFTF